MFLVWGMFLRCGGGGNMFGVINNNLFGVVGNDFLDMGGDILGDGFRISKEGVQLLGECFGEVGGCYHLGHFSFDEGGYVVGCLRA